MACVADEQADVTENTGPVTPYAIATREAAALGMTFGIVKGSVRRAPWRYSRRDSASWVVSPPIPVPMTTAVRGPEMESHSSDWASASAVAARENCTNKSVVLGSAGGAKPFTWAATGERSSDANGSASEIMPECARSSACHNPSEPGRGAETEPVPVIATCARRPFTGTALSLTFSGNQPFYHRDDITNRLDVG